MFFRLLILFITIPIIELALLLKLAEIMGTGTTLAIIILTGITGVWLAKQQGFIVLTRFQEALSHGEMPGNQIIDGMLILIGAAVLLTPGLITDIIGFFLLIPITRMLLREMLKKRLLYYFENGQFKIFIG